MSYLFQDGGTPERISFLTATTGVEVDLGDGDTDDFTYTYERTGDTTATFTARFKPDEWDEYELDFSEGTFVRREFKDNAIDDTDTGTFEPTSSE